LRHKSCQTGGVSQNNYFTTQTKAQHFVWHGKALEALPGGQKKVQNRETTRAKAGQSPTALSRHLPLGTTQYNTTQYIAITITITISKTLAVVSQPLHSSTSLRSVSPANRLRGALVCGRKNWRHISSAANR